MGGREMRLRDWFRHRLVKSARGFSPGKKLTGGMTIYKASMVLLSMELIVYARKSGAIDETRLSVLERVHGHFNEHVMFFETPRSVQVGVFSDMDTDYDEKGRHFFLQAWEAAARDLGRQLPDVVRKELVVHLALFLRVDTVERSEVE